MSTVFKRVILTNSIYVYLGEVLSRVILFIFNAIIARKLGVIDFGVYTLAYGIGLIIVGFVDFGTNNYIFKRVSEGKGNYLPYVRRIVIIESVLSIIATFGLSCFLIFSNYDLIIKTSIIILYFSLLFENLTYVYRNVLKGLERFDLDAIINVISSVLRVIISLLLFSFLGNIYGICIGVAFSTLVALTFSIYIIYNITKKDCIKPSSLTESIISTFKDCAVYAVSTILKGMYLKIDVVLVQSYISSFELGLYNSATKILFTLYFIPSGIVQVIFPTLNRLYSQRNYIHVNTIFPKIFASFFVLFNFFQVVLVFYANPIIVLIYGNKYIFAENIFKLAAMSFVFTSLTVLLNFTFIANNKVSLTNKYFSYSIFVKILLIVILTKRFGVMGAASALLLSELVQFIIFLFASIKNNFNFHFAYLIVFLVLLPFDLILILANINVLIKIIILLLLSVLFLQFLKINVVKYIRIIYKKILKKE